MPKELLRSLLIHIATAYKQAQGFFDKALGAAALERIPHKGRMCVFEGDGRLIDPDKLELGDDVYIGRNFFIRATGGISIGSYTHISRNVVLHTVNHNMNGTLLPYDRTNILRPIKIGEYVWIGMNCEILPGVSIGDGAVIGMGTTVSKDVEAGAIVVGSAQRVVGHRDAALTSQLLEQEKFLRIKSGWASSGK
ncbi:acyltransferase [Stenotrophomonas sp. NPDC078853]|uniref:acyltransferase n=1 Tax=Stenotrophomonas sp. NPDC078853 TaxID=3364534 RepID=UPI0038509D3D